MINTFSLLLGLVGVVLVVVRAVVADRTLPWFSATPPAPPKPKPRYPYAR